MTGRSAGPAITEYRRSLEAAVEPLLEEGEQVSVAAARSSYEGGLTKLGFTVAVVTDRGPDRLDQLLDPIDGVKPALETSGHAPLVRSSSGYPPFQKDRVGVQWTAEILIP